jgi:hypothetical protein
MLSGEAAEIDLDSATASLRMTDVPVTDAHDLADALTNGQTGAPPSSGRRQTRRQRSCQRLPTPRVTSRLTRIR